MECLALGPLNTNVYFLTSQEEAVVVDPAPGSLKKISALLEERGVKLTAVWITHSHWDHVADCRGFVDSYTIRVYVHKLDADNLTHPGSDGIPSWVPIQPVENVTFVADGEKLKCGDQEWTVIHTPGHSLGSVCFYNEREGKLISGDTLFRGTMGKVSFPTSDPDLMNETLLKLSQLPPETEVYPGHGPSTSIRRERSWMISR
jgi:glyoxylase-like metal-dependent hydrolase (beta-lactamase superfamily II)